MPKSIAELKTYLADLSKNGKLDLEVLNEINSSLVDSEKHISDLEKERKELQDKVVDLVMNTPVSNNPLTQGEKEPPKPKTLEECILEEATKEKQQKQKGDK